MEKLKYLNMMYISKVELPNSKTKIAIDLFTKMLKDIAIKDEVSIKTEYNKDTRILKIYAEAYDLVVDSMISIDCIVYYVFDIKNMERFAGEVYRNIRKILVNNFESIESFQKLGVDEHWEFLELWCM